MPGSAKIICKHPLSIQVLGSGYLVLCHTLGLYSEHGQQNPYPHKLTFKSGETEWKSAKPCVWFCSSEMGSEARCTWFKFQLQH